jgi:hypothetical protein
VANPRIIIGPQILREYVQEESRWEGAIQLHDHVGPFLFAKDTLQPGDAGISGQEAFQRLKDADEGHMQELWDFLWTVQKRVVEDVVKHSPMEFGKHWICTEKDAYVPWEGLDAWCRLREDIDMDFVALPNYHPDLGDNDWDVLATMRDLRMGQCPEAVTDLSRSRLRTLEAFHLKICATRGVL